MLLPGGCLSDQELLAIINAFHQLGMILDPVALNYRNCARDGGVEASRFLA